MNTSICLLREGGREGGTEEGREGEEDGGGRDEVRRNKGGSETASEKG